MYSLQLSREALRTVANRGVLGDVAHSLGERQVAHRVTRRGFAFSDHRDLMKTHLITISDSFEHINHQLLSLS